MNNNITKRFVECFRELERNGKVKSSRQFCLSLNYTPQSWSKILNGERSVTLELIRKATIIYNVNPTYLFTGVGNKFINTEESVVAVAVDDNDNEKILHVPVTAKAGYNEQYNDTVYLEDLESYSLPLKYFNSGTFRSFEVEGDSMEPVLQQGEIIVCSYVDQSLWEYNVKSGYVYVVVTDRDVLVKRVQNRLKEEKTIELESDNPDYPPIILDAGEIREMWIVKLKISTFAHSKINLRQEMDNKYSALNDIIRNQSELISRLNKTVEKLLQKQRIL